MKKIKISSLLLIGFFTFLISSCGGEDETVYDETQEDYAPEVPDYDTFSKELQDLENKIIASVEPNETLMKEAITKFQDFAAFFPEDAKSPDYLLKASDYALLVGQPEKSVKILMRIMDDYPNYDRMESVMFNKASHQDFELRDTTNAKKSYQEFIDKYPNSDLVDDAQNRIKYISLTLDELADKFIKDLESKPQ